MLIPIRISLTPLKQYPVLHAFEKVNNGYNLFTLDKYAKTNYIEMYRHVGIGKQARLDDCGFPTLIEE